MNTKMSAAFALLLLLSAAIQVSSKFEAYSEPTHFKAIEVDAVTGKVTRCNLWCMVKYISDNNQSLINRPYVHWEKASEKNATEFHPLRDVWYWYAEEGLSFLNSVRHYCDESQQGQDVYECGITIQRCSAKYAGQYRCGVYDFDSGSQVERNVSVKLKRDPNSRCYMPQAENITAEFITSNNGAHSIHVSWEYAERPRNQAYCNFSRQWQIRGFNGTTPHPFEDGKEPSLFRNVEFLNTTSRRDTFYVFQIKETKRNNYFQFQIQNRQRVGDTYDFIIRKYNSSVFTFKQQIPASLTLPQDDGETISVQAGQRLQLRCEAIGTPAPTVYLLKDVYDATWRSQDFGNGTAKLRVRTFESVKMEDAGLYMCLASNTLVGPPGGKRKVTDWKTIRVEVTEVQRKNVSKTIHCDSYAGSICSGYIRDDINVYIDGITIDGNYTTLLTHAASLIIDIRETYSAKSNTTSNRDLLTKCKILAEAMACHTVFPYCSPAEGTDNPTPRRICKTTCDAFRAGGVCESFINSQMSPDFYNSLMSNCDSRDDPAGSNPECIPVSLEPQEIETEKIHWCVNGNGRDYNGFQRRAESGLDCQHWQSQAPHRHPYTLPGYPELMGAGANCRNPGGVGERPWCYTSSSETRWEYCDIPECEMCTKYDQGFCSHLPGYGPGDSSIFVDRQDMGPGALHHMEYQMSTSYNKLISSQSLWSPGCDLALKQLICHTTFPFCSGTNQEPEAKAICSDHCKLLEVIEFCSPQVYMLLLEDNQLSMPDCSTASNIPKTGPNCMPVTLSHSIEDHHRHVECYNTSDLGQSYTGRREFTQHGALCQSWSEPHLLFDASLYPELNGAENFCRNPGRLREKPWCFTDEKSWDYCNLPTNCTDLPDAGKSLMPNHSSGNQSVYPIVFTVVGAVIIVLLVVSAIVFIRYMNHRFKRAQAAPPLPLSLQHVKKYPSDMKMIDNDNYVPLPNSKMAATIKKFQELDRQMEKASIRYIREIGRGNFGVVFQGKVSNLHDDEKEETVVAVKTLKDDCQEALEDFAREAKIMLQFDHPNIIRLYGVCTDVMPYYLVFEYMDQGDLAKFLRQNASSEQRRLLSTSSRHRSRTDSTISDDPPSLSPEQLTDMCKQIAKGMEYLAAKDHVHRDLACRNCLVKTCLDTGVTDSGYIIKIGDFGMSHDLYQRNYYRVQGQAVLPVRWMSPEAVIFGKFSSAGDVWSFGVVMWEIFSFAMQPYYGVSNEEVTKYIRTGRHLEKPFDCPRNTYEIMKQCWSAEPLERPSFADLYCMLEAHRMSVSSDESSLCSDTMSQTGSELDSDAFLEENSIDGVFVDMAGESQA